MRKLICSLLISLLILIQSQGLFGSCGFSSDEKIVATTETVTKAMGEVEKILQTYEKEDSVGKSKFNTKILSKLLTRFGNTAPIWAIATIAYGSVEDCRHKELLKKLDSLSQDISSLYHKFDSQTWDLKSEMRKIQQESILPNLITASENYENYGKKVDIDYYAGLLIKDFENKDIRTSVTRLRGSIRDYMNTSMEKHGNCNMLTDERVRLATLLANAAFALGAGCVEYAKKNRWTEAKTHRICDDLNSYKDIIKIEEIMIEEINKCTTSFAKYYTKKWIKKEIRTTDIDGTSERISSMLSEKFPQFSHTVVVYPPLHGFSKHATNFGVTLFRWKEMNIVVSILERRKRSCSEDNRDLNTFLTYKYETKKRYNSLTMEFDDIRSKVKERNDNSAKDLYEKLSPYGNTNLLVFKDSKYSVNGYPYNIWCKINYSDDNSGTTTIVYV